MLSKEQFNILKSELQNDPKELGYSGKTNEEIFILLTTKNIEANKNVPYSDVFGYCLIAGFWADVVLASQNSNSNIQKEALTAIGLKEVYAADQREIDVHHPQFIAIMDAMITEGIMTQENKSFLLAMGTVMISRWDQLLGVINTSNLKVGNIEEVLR